MVSGDTATVTGRVFRPNYAFHRIAEGLTVLPFWWGFFRTTCRFASKGVWSQLPYFQSRRKCRQWQRERQSGSPDVATEKHPVATVNNIDLLRHKAALTKQEKYINHSKVHANIQKN